MTTQLAPAAPEIARPKPPTDGAPQATGRRTAADVVGSFGLAYALCVALVVIPIIGAGVYSVLAITRLLDPLIAAGVVRYHDLDMGIVEGVGQLKNYLLSQTPVEWRLMLIVAAIYFVFFLLKAAQFHTIGRYYGMSGSFGHHARAFFYGIGLNRLLPYNTGDIATVAALEGQGESRARAASSLYVQELFVLFEIGFFLLLELLLIGWKATLTMMVWPLVFFGALYFVTRPLRRHDPLSAGKESQSRLELVRSLANDPLLITRLCLISLLAFFLKDLTPYITSQAFTSGPVIMNVPLSLIMGAVIAGHVTSRIPVTPGSIGQYEFGFATALYMSGVGLPEAIAIALLDGVIRNGVALGLFLSVRLWYGVETNLRTVMDMFMGKEPAPAARPQIMGENA
ncbi:MAG TPA: lysylphosphatidylglycerol synthase transmembrane domain-containing protein [Planctomycetaceae bacterium]|nr:lysylphosphatidylglycerol synthase transmembrane domain-containing protein [Planctomycetaceae bacterium]